MVLTNEVRIDYNLIFPDRSIHKHSKKSNLVITQIVRRPRQPLLFPRTLNFQEQQENSDESNFFWLIILVLIYLSQQ